MRSNGQRILAIDPGISGGCALFVGGAIVPIEPGGIIDVPTVGAAGDREIDVLTFRDWMLQMEPDVAVIERVRAMPSIPDENGVRRSMGATSAFNFGGAFRVLKAIPTAFNVPVRTIEPARWKKFYGLKGGDGGKERARQVALERWPSLHPFLGRKKDHQRAEAILLGNYFWKVEGDDEIPE